MVEQFDQKEFNDLKAQVDELDTKRLEHYKLFQKYERLHSKLFNKLTLICKHNWQKDHNSHEYHHTSYICKNCGKYS